MRTNTSRRPRGAVTALAAATVAITIMAAAGCGTGSSPLRPEAMPLPTAAPSPTSPGASTGPGTTPSARPTPTAAQTVCADGRPVRDSVSPISPMPTPGAMPAGSAMAKMASRGYLQVGVITDVPPLSSMNWQTVQFEGFDIDIAKEIAKAIFGTAVHRIRFQPVIAAERTEVLQRNAVDVVVATMTITCARKQDVRFSGVYYESGLRLLVRKNAGFKKIEDLAGFQVCSPYGTTSFEKLRLLPPPAPTPVGTRRAAECLVALQRGEVDGIASDDAVLVGMAAQDPYLEVLPHAFDQALRDELGTLDEPYGIALPRTGSVAYDNQFVAFVNGVLYEIMRNGRWQEIYDRWLGHLGPAESPLAANPNWPR